MEIGRRLIGRISGIDIATDHERVINDQLQVINKSEKTIRMVAEGLPEKQVADALGEAVKRGVKVELIFFKNLQKDKLQDALNMGPDIYINPNIHKPFALIDGVHAVMYHEYPPEVTDIRQYVVRNYTAATELYHIFEKWKSGAARLS